MCHQTRGMSRSRRNSSSAAIGMRQERWMRNAVRRREKHSFRTVFGASFNRSAASSTVKRSRKNKTLADGISLFSALIGMSHILSAPKLAEHQVRSNVAPEEAPEHANKNSLMRLCPRKRPWALLGGTPYPLASLRNFWLAANPLLI